MNDYFGGRALVFVTGSYPFFGNRWSNPFFASYTVTDIDIVLLTNCPADIMSKCREYSNDVAKIVLSQKVAYDWNVQLYSTIADVIKKVKNYSNNSEELTHYFAVWHSLHIGCLINPDFCKVFDITINDLKNCIELFEIVAREAPRGKRYTYLTYIAKSYVKNGDFSLTADQRLECYGIYKDARKIWY